MHITVRCATSCARSLTKWIAPGSTPQRRPFNAAAKSAWRHAETSIGARDDGATVASLSIEADHLRMHGVTGRPPTEALDKDLAASKVMLTLLVLMTGVAPISLYML